MQQVGGASYQQLEMEEIQAEMARRQVRVSLGLPADLSYPAEFFCPISHNVMQDPVVAADG